MRSISTAQKALYARDAVAPVKLVTLTTYNDRDAGTVQASYRISDRPVLYDYGDTGTTLQFEALLAKIDTITRSMNHLPSPSGDAASLGAELRLTLMNAEYRGGNRLYAILRALNLEWCDVEIATVLADASWFDLRALAGTEHVVHGRGTLRRVEGVSTDAIQLGFETPLPTIPWLYATDATITDPRDLGARLPIVYGRAKRVPCLNWEVGWTTTLAASVTQGTPAGAVILVSDATGFPITAFSLRVEIEEWQIAARSAITDQLILVSPATTAVDHRAGAAVTEILTSTSIVIAGHETSAVTALYLRNPYNQTVFRVASAQPADTADAVTVPGATTTTLTLSADDLRAVMDEAYQSAAVTVQPSYETTGTVQTDESNVNSVGYGYWGYGAHYGSWYQPGSGGPSAMRWPWPGAGYTRQTDQVANAYFSGVAPRTTALTATPIAVFTYDTSGSSSGGTFGFEIDFNNTLPGGNRFVDVTLPSGQTGTYTWIGPASNATGWNPAASLNGNLWRLKPHTPVNLSGQSSSNFIGCSRLGVIVTYSDAPQVSRIIDAQIVGAAVGYGLEWFADVDGPAVPATYTTGYGFEETSGWNASGCTVTSETSPVTEGTYALKIAPTVTTLDDCEATTGWSTYSSSSRGTVSLSGDFSRGAQSVQFETGYVGSQVWHGARKSFTAFDLTSKLFAFDLRVVNLAGWQYYGLTSTTGFQVFLSSDGFTANYIGYQFGTSSGVADDAWSTIVFDPAAATYRFDSAGSTNLAAINEVLIGFYPTSALAAGLVFRFDALRSLPAIVTAQRNATAGTVDLTASGLRYRLALRSTQAGADTIDDAGSVLYFSDTAGSGTTPPAARRELAIGQADVGASAWTQAEITATDVGSPTVANVETVGVTLALRSTPSGALHADPVIYLDDLECADDAASQYAGTIGSVIEHPADVMRHLLTERCGEDASVIDEASFAATATALGAAAKIGTDLRGLGDGFADVATRLAYESRANLVRDEGASAATYRLLTAGTSTGYAFGSSIRTISEWQRFSESGRDVGEIAARTLVYYDYDASLGTDERAYLGLLQATPELSDFAAVSAGTLAALEAKFGRRDTRRIFLRAISDRDTALDVAGYYVREATRLAALWILEGVAWWEAYDLERGDIVSLTPPWDTTARKARVIEIEKRFDAEVVNLRVVEVP